MTRKSIIAILSGVLLTVLISKDIIPLYRWFLIVFISIYTVVVFNIVVRYWYQFKPYFLHPLNVLTAKTTHTISFEIEPDIAFEKVQEVLNNTKFKIRTTVPSEYELLATARLSTFSWGENLYFNIDSDADGSKIVIESTTVFGWDLNDKLQKNVQAFINQFEESLII